MSLVSGMSQPSESVALRWPAWGTLFAKCRHSLPEVEAGRLFGPKRRGLLRSGDRAQNPAHRLAARGGKPAGQFPRTRSQVVGRKDIMHEPRGESFRGAKNP